MPSPEENAIILDKLQEIDETLNQLPGKIPKALLLSQLDGLTYSATWYSPPKDRTNHAVHA